jgi:hypothetical protein
VRGSRWLLIQATGNSGATIGHGLGVEPHWIIVKDRTGVADNWMRLSRSTSYAGTSNLLALNFNYRCSLLQQTRCVWNSTSCPYFNVSFNGQSVVAESTIKAVNNSCRLLLRPSSRVLFFWQLHRQWQRRWSVCVYTGFRPR